MQARTVERVESWDARPFSGGVDHLHELADADFSGAVSAGGTWLFLLNGRVIGVFEGEVEDVADAADGTVYEAPHESVALLYSMQERGGETQAKYYTNDTPLSEASETLSDAKFTGYIELSENVLSGDYYVVYYGGRSMSAAFVGTSEELVTGDEAFERADDEVGVYEVVKTPVNVTELPPREDGRGSGGDDDETAAAGGEGGGAGAASGAAAGAADDASTASETSDAAGPRGTDASLSTGSENAGASTSDDAPGAAAGEASPDEASGRRPSGDDQDDEEGGGAASGEDGTSRSRQRAQSSAESSGAGTTGNSGSDTSTGTGAAAEDGGAKTTAKAAASEGEQAFDDEREWRKTTSVPTIDPDDSASGGGGGSQSGSSGGGGSGGSRTKTTTSSSSASSPTKGRSSRSRSSSSSSGAKSTVEKLKQAVKQREQKLQAASERIDDLEDERDDLEERVEDLESERDELQSTVEDLESELAAAEASGGNSGGDDNPAARDLNPVDALSGTNLFVRYDSKGAPTLDELKDTTDPAAVNENLRIDHHTQFDAGSATVNGEAFESFLPGTTVHRFVSWAVRALPYEVRDSGHKSGLADLYDALPRVDRAELNGTVEVNPDEDTTVSRTFDVVLRDRMGNPLVVADVRTGRDPVTGDQMDALVEDATAIREGTDDLAAAMYVTGSFFEPAALETADEATAAGGLFSRSDRESFVKVGRKAGYHLCLVEDRNDAFHLTVPEL